MSKRLKVGVIGAGGISRWHMPGWQASEHAEVVAASDIYEPGLQDWGKTFGVTRLTTDWRELLADRGGLNERIIYWVRVGDEFPIGWADQRLTMALSNARGVTPDGVLFRVSTIEEDPERAASALRMFIKAFIATSSSSFRETVLF